MISFYLCTTPGWIWYPAVAIFAVGVVRTARMVIGWLDSMAERVRQRRARR